jgi:hypothetical protein
MARKAERAGLQRGDDDPGLGKVLGSISPLYGALTGRGLIGKAMAGFHDATGMGGVLPMIASEQRRKRREKREGEDGPATGGRGDVDAMMGRAAPRNLDAGEGMKRGGKAKAKKYAKGGKVSSASKRADGCATKGKTKGRFV